MKIPKQVAIVGAGPSGFYLAQELLKSHRVTLFESLLTPFGLVRYGVAPDHFSVKNSAFKFEKIAQNENFKYIGNCTVGRDISVATLLANFDAVCISTGSKTDRLLNIVGENSGNVFSGKDFVGWYNGHPKNTSLNPDLSGKTAVIIGQGNVALDCARILLCPTANLEKTDIAEYAMEKLKSSNIERVHVIGRRGVLQASFTAKEIREIVALPKVKFIPDREMAEQIDYSTEFLAKNRAKKRVMDLLKTSACSSKPSTSKAFLLDFLKSPKEIYSDPLKKTITGLKLEINKLEGDSGDPLKMKAVGTGETISIKCDLLVKCIGFMNEPFPELPFQNGVIPNVSGRVFDGEKRLERLYVSGWIKTGPVGVLAATLYDAQETARSIEYDLGLELSTNKRNLKLESKKWTDFQDWLRIDNKERSLGKFYGKERHKICLQSELEDISFTRSTRVL